MNARHTGITIVPAGDTGLLASRMFDAPRELVWDALTKPEHIRRWWGRAESSLTVCEVDLRPGGTWRHVERHADGQEYPFRGEYREVVPPARIVFTQVFDVPPFDGQEMVVACTLEDRDGKTLLTATMTFATRDDRDEAAKSDMEAGMGESWDRLAALLETLR